MRVLGSPLGPMVHAVSVLGFTTEDGLTQPIIYTFETFPMYLSISHFGTWAHLGRGVQ